MSAERFAALYADAERRHGLPPGILSALASVESAHRPNAVSVAGALGLLQVMPDTARRYGVSPNRLLTPADNIDTGARVLADFLRRTGGNVDGALSAYNGGYRPSLGFGEPLTRDARVCLAWRADAPAVGRDINRDCARIWDGRRGSYGNQPYVEAVRRAWPQAVRTWPVPPGGLGGLASADVLLIVAVLAILAVYLIR